jgi:hypothetical protein
LLVSGEVDNPIERACPEVVAPLDQRPDLNGEAHEDCCFRQVFLKDQTKALPTLQDAERRGHFGL